MTVAAPKTAIVTGATGQDGHYLVARLLAEGVEVHATVRGAEKAGDLAQLVGADHLIVRALDITDGDGLCPTR